MSGRQKKRVAILHPTFGFGGAEAVCIEIANLLKKDFLVDIITADKVSLNQINVFYGKEFEPPSVNVINLHLLLRGSILDSHIIQRYYKQRSHHYLFPVSTLNEMDFGKVGIQYIHYPLFKNEKVEAFNFFRKMYQELSESLSGYSEIRMKENVTFTNSFWTQQRIKEIYGIESKVIYPPVDTNRGAREELSFERENGFLCVGRVVPEKNILKVIEIVRRVREKRKDIHLHIVGGQSNSKYFEKIFYLSKKYSSWLFIEGSVSRDRLIYLLNSHKYGIHGMKNEHFGISIAEMVDAGCIVFVPNEGGQKEVVGNTDSLLYSNEDEAVRKIINVVDSVDIQNELKSVLKKNSLKFRKENFAKEFLKSKETFLSSFDHNN